MKGIEKKKVVRGREMGSWSVVKREDRWNRRRRRKNNKQVWFFIGAPVYMLSDDPSRPKKNHVISKYSLKTRFIFFSVCLSSSPQRFNRLDPCARWLIDNKPMMAQPDHGTETERLTQYQRKYMYSKANQRPHKKYQNQKWTMPYHQSRSQSRPISHIFASTTSCSLVDSLVKDLTISHLYCNTSIKKTVLSSSSSPNTFKLLFRLFSTWQSVTFSRPRKIFSLLLLFGNRVSFPLQREMKRIRRFKKKKLPFYSRFSSGALCKMLRSTLMKNGHS